MSDGWEQALIAAGPVLGGRRGSTPSLRVVIAEEVFEADLPLANV